MQANNFIKSLNPLIKEQILKMIIPDISEVFTAKLNHEIKEEIIIKFFSK